MSAGGTWGARGVGATLLVVGLALSSTGCPDYVMGTSPDGIVFFEQLSVKPSPRMDLLFAIDNSPAMADKQRLFAEALAKSWDEGILGAVLSPRCVDSNGVPAQQQPSGALEDCPTGTKREFNPVPNVHVGFVTSSLGGHGSDACPVVPGRLASLPQDDGGRLLTRAGGAGMGSVPTYQGLGFLSWDPEQELSPPGDDDPIGFFADVRALATGAGETGCVYESQLESVYRFLVDPEPYASISVNASGQLVTEGVDDLLLAQRAAFLRPDSLLMVLMVSDENDCSVRETAQHYLALQQLAADGAPYHLARGRAVCLTDPLSSCCRPCDQPAGSDDSGNPCPEDPSCADGVHDELSDPPSLRCFDQKRRFGVDYLYPVERYVEGLAATTISDRKGQLVPNPLYSGGSREPGLVFLGGLLGVPWQDTARNPYDVAYGFKNFDELSAPDARGVTGWDVILGEPANGVAPLDPHMRESVSPRTGENPFLGTPMAPPGSPDGTNPINGHEFTTSDDLQYACVFQLPEPRDCDVAPEEQACDCREPDNDNPLCASDNPFRDRTIQVNSKAYPSLRQLAVVKGLGAQAGVASICASKTTDPYAPDDGYRVQLGNLYVAAANRLKSFLGGICLDYAPALDRAGRPPCVVIEARSADSCECNTTARQTVQESSGAALARVRRDPAATDLGWSCFCEVTQLEGDELDTCREDISDPPVLDGAQVDGWCYLDGTVSRPVGNVAMLENCPSDAKRLIRFVGEGAPAPSASLFVACAAE
jgi:hypothetical protein